MTFVTEEQKRTLYKDGYIVVKNAVSDDLVASALTRIEAATKGEKLGQDATMTDLVNASTVTPILNEIMGEFDPPTHCQIGVNKPRQPGEQFNQLGYHEKDQPYYAAESHIDGTPVVPPRFPGAPAVRLSAPVRSAGLPHR